MATEEFGREEVIEGIVEGLYQAMRKSYQKRGEQPKTIEEIEEELKNLEK